MRKQTLLSLSCPRALRLAAVLALASFAAPAAFASGDILRGGTPASTSTGVAPSSGSVFVPTTQIRPNPTDQLARTTQAIAAVRAMQVAAHNLAIAGPNSLAPGLLPVPVNSYQQPNGLVVATGVPANLTSSGPGEDPNLWTGASLPTVATATVNGTTTQTVTIQQTSQQAVLNWQTFNIGKNTVLSFDQATLGGADVANWIAFNKVGITGDPSQILGAIQAQGQVYVINPNGIIFGGSAQINTHALVASSLPLNSNLLASGLLDNPDQQFLFSGLALPAGTNGPTAAFTPLVSDAITPSSTALSFTTQRGVSDPGTISLSFVSGASVTTSLVAGTDYTVAPQATRYSPATVTLTASGLAQTSGLPVLLSYTPTASSYGDVSVQPGAVLFSPTANNTGGRIALVGPNVDNAGTLSAPNGQVILAAGLQVGFAAHAKADPSLRGLGVYVGQVTDPSAAPGYTAGTATNDVGTDDDGNAVTGVLETTDLSQTNASGVVTPVDLPGAVTMVGMAVNQMGLINSSTTVSFNGRVDLLADFNAQGNPFFDPTGATAGSLPFSYAASNTTGVVTLGSASLIDIVPSSSLTDKIVPTYTSPTQLIGGLALRSQINIQGQAIHLSSNVPDGSASIPAGALAATVFAPNALVSLQAGTWSLQNPGGSTPVNQFIFSGGQVYFDQGTLIDVSGTEDATAPVTENIVAVQLLGAQLADSPLQRNGPLRGQTVDVDLRVHGPWDPATGTYAWVGTPLADASGYVGLVQRTADELTTAGGNVSVQAGGSVVMQPGSQINVSGGWIDYQSGYVQTTKVVSGGQIYDISDASPNLVYSGIYTGTSTTVDPKWGISQTTANQVQLGYTDPGYTLGGDAGAVSIASASVALDGGFVGQAFSGPRQVLTQPAAGSQTLMALPGQFSLDFVAQTLNQTVILNYSPTPPNVVFQSGEALAKDAPVPDFTPDPTGAYALAAARQDEVDLSPSLIDNGFEFLSVDASADDFGTSGRTGGVASFGNIIVPANTSSPGQPSLSFGPATALAAFLDKEAGNTALAALNLVGANVSVMGPITAPGGTLVFRALDISPSRSALDASVFLNGVTYSPVTAPDGTRGAVTLGPDAILNVAGQVVDYRLAATDVLAPIATVGGSVTLLGYQTTLNLGSSIDVSGGATVSAAGKIAWGSAGSIDLEALDQEQFDGALLTLPATYTGSPAAPFAMAGYSGSSGGSLKLQGPLIQIGGAAADDTLVMLDPQLFSSGGFSSFNIVGMADSAALSVPTSTTPASHVQGLLVGASFIPAAGSQSTTTTSTTTTTTTTTGTTTTTTTTSDSGATAAALFVVAPEVEAYEADLQAVGSSILKPFTPTAALQFPIQITLRALGDTNVSGNPLVGNLVVGSNASILLNPNAASQLTLKGDTVAIYGAALTASTASTVSTVPIPTETPTLSVPGGSISIVGGSASDVLFQNVVNPLATVYLGPNAVLSAAGAPVLTTNAQGFTVGSILPGGSISLTGNVVAEKGSLLDVSGSSGTVDLSPQQTSLAFSPVGTTSGRAALQATTLSSNGGSIALNGTQELFSDATLIGAAGGPSATGGTLSVQSGQFLPGAEGLAPSVVPTLLLTAKGLTVPTSFFALGTTAIGQPIVDENGNPVSIGQSGGVPYFGGKLVTSSFTGGGFAWLTFGGSVEYTGSVVLQAQSGVTLGTNGIIIADPGVKSSLNISAPYVALGTAFQPPTGTTTASYSGDASPTYGTGILSVSGANLIDVGNLSLQGIGNAELATAPGGDLRGDGTLDVSGNLTLKAGQIYPPTAVTFNVAAYDPVSAGGVPVLDVAGTPLLGTVTLSRTGTPGQVPLSAGGRLNIFASDIVQDGVLRAPLGVVTLGIDSTTATAEVDPITGASFPTAQTITVGQGSLTSVSTIDPATGLALAIPIPYGNNLNGTAWIDPTGANITVNGPVTKQVVISAANVNDQASSTVDIGGGGDLYAYRMVSGVNGTVDILGATSNSFAIIPGYNEKFAPYGAFNTSVSAQDNLGNDPGYVSQVSASNTSSKIQVGSSIYIDIGNGAGPQAYTLLPARYALLPGAYLVTPEAGASAGAVKEADGSSVVPAYAYNPLATGQQFQPLFTSWELAPSLVVNSRAEYDPSLGNTFFTASASANNVAVPRLPEDAGQLLLLAQSTMTLQGKVNAAAATTTAGVVQGLGGLVDVASPQEIVVTGPNTDLSQYKGDLLLSSTDLSSFGTASLLIGGYRTFTTSGTEVTVLASNVLVDNGPAIDSSGNVILNAFLQPSKPGASLSGSDITLVANRTVAVAPNSTVTESGSATTGAEKLLISDSVNLQPGETVGFDVGGVPIGFPNGASFTVDPNVGGLVTAAGGVTTTVAAGAQVVLAPGSTFTFNPINPSTGASLVMNSGGGVVSMVTGDGAALRVSSDPNAQIVRTSVSLSSIAPTGVLAGSGLSSPGTVIFQDATVSGGPGSLIVDSTNDTRIITDSSGLWPNLSGNSMSFDSGSINLVFQDSTGPGTGLVLPVAVLQNLSTPTAGLQTTTSLSLLSYGAIGTFGSGTLGTPSLTNLGLHASQISNQTGGSVTFSATNVQLDNAGGGVLFPTGTSAPVGSLTVNALDATGKAGVLQIGSALSTVPLELDLFSAVQLNAGGGVLLEGSGGLNAVGSSVGTNPTTTLAINAPVITAAVGTHQTISAGGALTLVSPTAPTANAPQAGLGGAVTFEAPSIAANGNIVIPSGTVTLHSTSGDINIGGTINLSGEAKAINDLIQYSGGGQIALVADAGAVNVASTGVLNVAAALDPSASDGSRVGNAGSILVSAIDPTHGQFVNFGTLDGQGGFSSTQVSGALPSAGGSFSMDVGRLANISADPSQADPSLGPIDASLNSGGFNLARQFRVRNGDVTVEGSAEAHDFTLSADTGNIVIDGMIDASGSQAGTINVAGKPGDAFGNVGGSIFVAAGGSVTVESGGSLSVAGAHFNAAGKGGSVALDAGSSIDGIAPASTEVRDPVTGSFLNPVTPVVNLQAGSTIDLSVADATVALVAGQTYLVPEGTQDLISSTVAGTVTSAGTVTAFAAGILPVLAPGSTIALASSGNLTFLTNAADGTATGTLSLRAPQTIAKTGKPVDVQIDPINASLVDPSSIVIEGYKVFTPLDGYIDSTEVAIDQNGQSFAGPVNTASILRTLTANWGHVVQAGGLALNSLIDPVAGPQVHVRPGAEIDGTSGASTTDTVAFAQPGPSSSLTVPAGTTLTLPSTTPLGQAPSSDNILFSSGVLLTPTDAGSYTVSSLTPANPDLAVFLTTSVSFAGSVAAGSLTSTVGGTLTTNGTGTAFAAGSLPAIPAGSTLTFVAPGTLSNAASGTIALQATTSFVAGSKVSIPANSVVALGTDGGSVTFATPGTLTWSSEPQIATALIALNVAAGGVVALPSSSGADSLIFSSAATLIPVGSGSYTFLSLPASGSVPVLATTAVAIPGSLTSGTLTATVGGTVTVSGATTSFPAGPLPALSAGSTVAFTGTGVLSNTTTGALALTDTTAFAAGTTVSVPALSSVALGTRGGTVTFASAGTITSAPSLPFASNALAVNVPAFGALVLADTTPVGQAPTTESVSFNQAATITPVDAGTSTAPYSLTALNPTLAFNATTSLSIGAAIGTGNLSSNVSGAITLSNGTTSMFAAGPLPAIPSGSVLSFAAAGTLTNTSGVTASVKAINPFPAGTVLVLPAQSVVTLGTDGATVLFGPTAGTLTASDVAGSISNSVAVQVPAGGSFTTGSGGTLVSANGGNGTALTLNKASTSSVGGSLTLSAGGSLFLPNGTDTASANGTVTTNTIQIGSSIPASAGPATVTLDSTSGGTLTFVNATSGTITTGKGGTQQLATGTLSTGGIQLADGGELLLANTGQITSTAPGTVTFAATLSTLPLSLGGPTTVTLSDQAGAGEIVSTLGGSITVHGTVTFFAPGPLPALSSGSIVQVAGGSLSFTSAQVSSLPITVMNPLIANTATVIPAGGTVNILGAGLVASTAGPLNGVTIFNDLAPGVAAAFSPGDIVTLAHTADVVTVQSAGAFDVASPGPITLATNSLNPTSSKINFVTGTGNLLTVVAAGNYSTNGPTGIVTSPSGGDLVLANSWDLSNFRYGPNVIPLVPGSGEPGNLTVRAAGNLIIDAGASLSDGFMPSTASTSATSLWQAPLLAPGSQSWSYTLVAGGDLAAANPLDVVPISSLSASSGSVLVGFGSAALPASPSVVTRTAIIPKYFETIRTGTGAINIAAGVDVQLLDSLSTIYTAGTQVANPNSIASADDFDLPNTYYNVAPGGAGSNQNYSPSANVFSTYPVQYSFGGGNISISAQQDIAHYLSVGGTLVADSSTELPGNWLYRRGYVDSSGGFGTVQTKDPNNVGLNGGVGVTTEVASTSWWVDFSNYFEGVGTLGGGNVTLSAGRNVSNVDAAAATNERTTKQVLNPTTGVATLAAASQANVELGGGNVSVTAGDNIDGGIYYVERGNGALVAGGEITTNATRTTLNATGLSNFVQNAGAGASPDPTTWLPTSLFLGAGNFDVLAGGSVELGSIANPFLLPQGIDNSFYQTSYFSTYAPTDSVQISSLQGDVTLKGGSASSSDGTLFGWYSNVLNNAPGNLASTSEPWLRLNQYQGNAPLAPAYLTTSTLTPGTFSVTAFSGNINLQGDVTLAPAPAGSLNLLAAGSINGLQPLFLSDSEQPASAGNPYNWSASTIDLSDADPARVPGVDSPLGYLAAISTLPPSPPGDLMTGVAALFHESGATTGSNVVLQTELALHGPNDDFTSSSGSDALHGNDTTPAYVYAGTGDISGLTLYSSKSTRVIAAQDITDVGLYIQNTSPTSVSVVSAGRDLVPYDSNSPLLLAAFKGGSEAVDPQSGDIQISGPGTLEVLAGRKLELGESVGQSSNGLSVGITSIGNTRNPFLPFSGANIVMGAGLGGSSDLNGSALDFGSFTAQFLNPNTGGAESTRYLPDLGLLMGFAIDTSNPNSKDAAIWAAFSSLPVQQQDLLAFNVFYDVLRDSGRDHNNTLTPGFGNFNAGYEAIAALFDRKLNFTDSAGTGFEDEFLDPATGGTIAAHYLPVLAALIGSTSTSGAQIWSQFQQLPAADQQSAVLKVFNQVLADGVAEEAQTSTVSAGKATISLALNALFAEQGWQGNILLDSRSVETTNGGDINVFAPGGGLSLGFNLGSSNQAPPGIITAHGGNISIFTNNNVDVGVLRIFTLFGGNEIIWSSTGNIAAGASSKTVQSAPPTQVLVDPQSANVQTDLAGLATGGGIGVLATLAGVAPGNVDLIAPVGAIDAGDAGIRASGTINLAAPVVLNAGNIQAGGTIVGAPPAPAVPNIGALAAGSNATASATSAANEVSQQSSPATQVTEIPSVITVDVLGYGGSDNDDSDSDGSN